MKTINTLIVLCVIGILATMITGCDLASQERADRALVENQQEHYAMVHPLPFYDYSIPRDIVVQIYNVVTQEARSTYTVIESMTGETKFHGPSVGYGIPADVSLTNPLRPMSGTLSETSAVIEQAEPNGLFSSKNTDGTWVLFTDANGDVTPVYTEHKVTTFPFAVIRSDGGEWVRSGTEKASMTIKMRTQ